MAPLIGHRQNDDMKRPHAKPRKSSELKEQVALRFAAACKAYQPIQAELARELQITPQQLNGYLRRKNYPDEAVLVRFCDISGCTLDWIFRGLMESQVSAEMAARIGHFSPELIRGLLASEEAPAVASASRQRAEAV
jgi:transcriptional regulator with XRE-family HTH domain